MLPKTITIKTQERKVFLIDQTVIPQELKIVEIKTIEEMFNAIRTMVVRGAPAIGVAAAAGMALFVESLKHLDFAAIKQAGDYLNSSRPTAVNLSWATAKVVAYCSPNHFNDLTKLKAAAWQFAAQLAEEDEAINRAMGKNGADLVSLVSRDCKVNVLTHCNTGSLATVYWGTALGVVRELQQRGQINHVYADETRPRLQGGKLTAWELLQENIPSSVITDNMAAYFMGQGKIDIVFVGADRIASNGDTANKIGTYNVAIIANYHHIPFYVVAPLSTIDVNIASGDEIPIEERDSEEVTHVNGQRILPVGVTVTNPSFDITPASLITGIVTEKKVISGNLRDGIKSLFGHVAGI
jgi:methylthioribose-1-phosphate isomerase